MTATSIEQNGSLSNGRSSTKSRSGTSSRSCDPGKVNAWTGNKVREFEEAYAALLGRRHAIALANGTVALDVALHAIGLQPGDEVIVTPRSFVASASCVPMAGGVPVFADVDAESQAITAESIAAVLTPRTRAVIVVHLAGWPADMDPIMRLADQKRHCRHRGLRPGARRRV